MDLFTAMQVGGSGLQAQRTRLNLTAQNLANANTTQTPEGGPYRAKQVVLGTENGGNGHTFQAALDQASRPQPEHVTVQQVNESQEPAKEVYDPSHPHANEEGYVAMPNVDTVTQMTNLMDATRAYKANTQTVSAAREMAMNALRIGQ
ncbi:MAG: flagellar basal body rod protein FlgC [Thiohalorhabdus sp.]|uniref:flagellar basal body rod protein FlgC n=1 Tax=Thiohalorhabdus sp. TaxID=3094134 RepID=UPI002FC3818D